MKGLHTLHVAGRVGPQGQRCLWCGLVLAEPRLTPFAMGATILLSQHGGMQALTVVASTEPGQWCQPTEWVEHV